MLSFYRFNGQDLHGYDNHNDVPGANGRRNVANAKFPLVALMLAGATCTGTVGMDTNVCVVKCANPVGPFGSNVLVQKAAPKNGRSMGAGRSLAARAKVMMSL